MYDIHMCNSQIDLVENGNMLQKNKSKVHQ